ncbi:MAG: FHA domain-containing protein [Planctomycetes bacterium]|nr:FHA domain-containing protein [Planctomycetota bacterium]
MKLTVVHLEGSKQGLTESLAGQVITIGRDPSNTLSFDPFKDLDVSTRHATLTQQGDQVVLQDLGSTNGTYLNGQKLTAAVSIPPGGCMIKFGENGPKVQLSYTLDEGPGKKTVMIEQLRTELDDAGESKRRSKSRMVKVVGLLIMLAIIAGGVAMILSNSAAHDTLVASVADSSKKATKQRGFAVDLSADTVKQSKDEFALGDEAIVTGKAAEENGELEAAKTAYGEAAEHFDVARNKAAAASRGQLLDMQKRLEASATRERKVREEQRKREQAQLAKLQEELKKREATQAAKLAALEKKLQAAEDVAALIRELRPLEKSSNPKELEQGIAVGNTALKDLDPKGEDAKLLGDLIKTLEGILTRVKDLNPESLKEIARRARTKVLLVKTKVFAIPSGETEETTEIRYPVAEGEGTGFYVSKDGHVVTAKEVVSPELFDPKALARKIKLAEKGVTFLRKIQILAYDATSKVYQPVEFNGKLLEVVIAREFAQSKGEKRTVTIEVDGAETKVEVRPHLRDESDLVVLKVEGGGDLFPFLEISPETVSENLPCIALGVQEDREKNNELALFMFDGRVKKTGKVHRLGVPSFTTWRGGPILDARGRVVGVLVRPDVVASWAANIDEIRKLVDSGQK